MGAAGKTVVNRLGNVFFTVTELERKSDFREENDCEKDTSQFLAP